MIFWSVVSLPSLLCTYEQEGCLESLDGDAFVSDYLVQPIAFLHRAVSLRHAITSWPYMRGEGTLFQLNAAAV